MAAIRPRDLLSEDLLERFGAAAYGDAGYGVTYPADASGAAAPTWVRTHIAELADIGYLNVALPPEFGGLGCTLRQAACGQRRLARVDPRTALAVSAHLYWTGAAADAYRTGDESVRWILIEAAHGALFAGGHAGRDAPAGVRDTGADLRFADPRSRCEPAGNGGYQFHDPGVLSTVTPGWDWLAVHGIHHAAKTQAVIAFAGRSTRFMPAFRVVRVEPAGNPGDAFATSALTWGHTILASVRYSDARRAFNAAVAVAADGTPVATTGPATGSAVTGAATNGPAPAAHPLDAWGVAEAGLRLDTMKSRIAEISHPWPLVPAMTPDVGGQHLISIYAMRHEVDEGAARVHELISHFGGSPVTVGPLGGSRHDHERSAAYSTPFLTRNDELS
jgi:hypothetical protein